MPASQHQNPKSDIEISQAAKKTPKKQTAKKKEPELRTVPLVAGNAVVVASNVNVRGQAKLNSEVITRLNKGQQVAVEGRIQTRTWDDEKGNRHWKTEIVAASVEMLSGRKKKDYAAESSADALEAAAEKDEDAAAAAAAAEPIPEEVAA